MACNPEYNTRIVAKGTSLFIARAVTPTVFVRVAGVKEISMPKGSRAEIDGDELDPQPDTIPTGECAEMYFFKKMYPGTKTYGAAEISLNLNWTQYKVLLDVYVRDEICIYKVLFRTGATAVFAAYLKEFALDVKTDEFIQMPISVQPVSNVTFVDGP